MGERLGRFKSAVRSSEYFKVKLSEMDFSYTFASGGSAFELATDVYFVAENATLVPPAA